jgi:hypothetical protein
LDSIKKGNTKTNNPSLFQIRLLCARNFHPQHFHFLSLQQNDLGRECVARLSDCGRVPLFSYISFFAAPPLTSPQDWKWWM